MTDPQILIGEGTMRIVLGIGICSETWTERYDENYYAVANQIWMDEAKARYNLTHLSEWDLLR